MRKSGSSPSSTISHGLRSPMIGTIAGTGRMPPIADNTNMPNSAPRAARMQSAMPPKNPSTKP